MVLSPGLLPDLVPVHHLAVRLGIVPIPPVPLAIVAQLKVLQLLIRGNVLIGPLGTQLSGPLQAQFRTVGQGSTAGRIEVKLRDSRSSGMHFKTREGENNQKTQGKI